MSKIMASNFKNQAIADDLETEIDQLYDKWMSLGMGMNGTHYITDLDLEKTIAETTQIGRYESRLLWAMLTWIVTYGDLINVSRMMHFLQTADAAVLGGVLELAVKHGGDKKLLNIVKRCKPREVPELLFPRMKKHGFTYAQELTEARDEWKKWGYYSSETSFMYDAILGDRMFIFKHQKNLAVRAIFGPNLRAEILYYLYKNSETYIKEISKATGFAYFPVYNETKELIRNGLLRSTTYGRMNVVSLNDSIFQFIQNAPA
jgi:hypothetical protein